MKTARVSLLAIAGLAVFWNLSLAAQPATPMSDALKALLKEGFAQIERRQPERAEKTLNELLEKTRAEHNVVVEAEALRGLGLARANQNDPKGARERYEAALALFQSIDHRAGMGQTRNALGILAWQAGDWKATREHFSAAADDFAAAQMPSNQAQALRNITFSRDPSLTMAEKEALVERAAEIARRAGDARVLGGILHQWGDLINVRGDYAAAIVKLEEALPLLEQKGTPSDQANLLTSLGRTYRLHGVPERALPLYDKAYALAEKARDLHGMAQTRAAHGTALWIMGRRSEALAELRSALDLARRSGDTAQIADREGNVAGLLNEMGAYREALDLTDDALAHKIAADVEGLVRLERARSLSGVGRQKEALGELERGLALVQSGDAMVRAAGVYYGAIIKQALGDRDGALAYARQALESLESQRGKLVPRDDMKRSFADMYADLFTMSIDLLLESGDAAGAFEAAERARARAFLDLLATRDIAGRSREGMSSTVATSVPSLRDAQATAARLHSTLLSYWVAPEATYVWAVPPVGPVVARKVAVKQRHVARLALQMSAALSGPKRGGGGDDEPSEAEGAPEEDAPAPATRPKIPVLTRGGETLALDADKRALLELYDLLIKPIQAALPAGDGSLLTIVPHGPLFRVSFAALQDAQGRYLVESHRLHYAPAAALMEFTAREHAKTTGGKESYLLVADPDLDADLRVSQTLPPLPGARDEVEAIAKLLPRASASVLIGKDATKARVREMAGDRSVVHLATHGVVSDRDPLSSYLALAKGGVAESGDGRLKSSEIYGLQLRADLVVLSACRSAAGKVSGDGIIGLTRAFLYAGAPSLLATLWDLADEPARYMVPRFYASWRKTGNKAEALRTAQIALIRALRAGEVKVKSPFGEIALPENPALWAAFVLLGEP